VTSFHEALYVDISRKLEVDIDAAHDIDNVQCILSTPEKFYVLSNKKEQKLGYYLIAMDINDPGDSHQYLINWTNKLDIASSDMYHMVEHQHGERKESLVVSYKSVGINTFNVFVFDLAT